MIISFFEEFPITWNISKLKLISGPTKVYLAARSLTEFNCIKKKKNAQYIYWPILEKEEGYWISPFAKRKALQRIFAELRNKKIPVMLDLELPLKRSLLRTDTQ